MDKAIGNVADVDVVALEIFLENDDIPVGNCRIDKVVNQQVKTHAGRHSEYGRESQGYNVRRLQQHRLGLSFCPAVKRDRLQWGIFGAKKVAGLRAVTAIGRRIDDYLLRAAQAIE